MNFKNLNKTSHLIVILSSITLLGCSTVYIKRQLISDLPNKNDPYFVIGKNITLEIEKVAIRRIDAFMGPIIPILPTILIDDLTWNKNQQINEPEFRIVCKNLTKSSADLDFSSWSLQVDDELPDFPISIERYRTKNEIENDKVLPYQTIERHENGQLVLKNISPGEQVIDLKFKRKNRSSGKLWKLNAHLGKDFGFESNVQIFKFNFKQDYHFEFDIIPKESY